MSIISSLQSFPRAEHGPLTAPTPSSVNDVSLSDHPHDAARDWYAALSTTPVWGERTTIDGVPCHAVTFVAWHEGPETPALTAPFTGPALQRTPTPLQRVAETPLFTLSLWLPSASAFSYDFQLSSSGQAHTGAHQVPVYLRDAKNPTTLSSTHDDGSQPFRHVTHGPCFTADAVWKQVTQRPGTGVSELQVTHDDGRVRPMWLWRNPSPTTDVVLMFDGDGWHAEGMGAQLFEAAGLTANVLLVSSMELQDRNADLPHPAACAVKVRDCLQEYAKQVGLDELPPPDAVTLVGQSYGGLAAASIVLLHPTLARNAVVQSGSFHFDPQQQKDRPAGVPPTPDEAHAMMATVGSLRRALRQDDTIATSARLAVTAGREEPIYHQTQGFLEECAARGIAPSYYREDYGWHDYALWRHQLFPALHALQNVS